MLAHLKIDWARKKTVPVTVAASKSQVIDYKKFGRFYPYFSGNILKWVSLLKFGVPDHSEVR